MSRVLAATAATVLLTAGCSNSTDELSILAASSLVDVLAPATEAFDRPTTASFSGSSTIATQVNQGRDVDIVITANEATMQRMIDAGSIAGEPVVIATNQLVIAVPRGNPAGVTGLTDLASTDLTIAACAPEVPCGAAAAQVAANAGIELAIDTLDPNVRSVLTRVTTGVVDAGLVYTTDAQAVADELETIAIDPEVNVTNRYFAAIPVDADPAAAELIAHLTTAGQAAFAAAGFGTP